MRSKFANYFMLMFVWSAVTGCPPMLYSQELPLPPRTETPSVVQQPVDQPEPARKVIASLGKRLRAVEDSKRDDRRQAPEWFAIEEALADVLKTLESHGQLAPASEVRFAKAVLTALIPDNEEDKLAVAARDVVLALLQERKEAALVSSETKHKWLEVSARFKEVSVAARAAQSIKAQERDGWIIFDFIFDAEQRLLNAKRAFARAAFAVFPVDRGNEMTVGTIESAFRIVELKNTQRLWAVALEQWVKADNHSPQGQTNSIAELSARETVYHYEAKCHEAVACVRYGLDSRPLPKTVQETLKRLKGVEDGELKSRRQAPEWFAIEEALEEVLKSINADGHHAPGSDARFAKAVLTALIPDNEEYKPALAARNDVLVLVQERKESERAFSHNKHKWLEVSVGLKRLSAAARIADSIRSRQEFQPRSLDMSFNAEQRLLDAKTEFASSAFALFPIDRGNEEAVQRIEHALQVVKQKYIQEARTAALCMWVPDASIGEAMAREMAYYFEAKWHEAKAESPFEKSQFDASFLIPKSRREMVAWACKELKAVEDSKREMLRQATRWFAIDVALENILKSLDADGRLSPGSDVGFTTAVLRALIPDGEADKPTLEARDDVLALFKESKDVQLAFSHNKHKWLEVSARWKRLFPATQFTESLKANLGEQEYLDLILQSEQRLLNAKTEFASAAFAMFPIDRGNKEAVQRIEHALQVVQRKHIQESWAAALETWAVLYALREGGQVNSIDEAATRDMVYYYEAKWHETKAR